MLQKGDVAREPAERCFRIEEEQRCGGKNDGHTSPANCRNLKSNVMLNKKITFDRFIRWALIALLVVTVLYIVSYLSNVLLPFFVAWLLAYLLYPIVRFVQYKLHVRVRA